MLLQSWFWPHSIVQRLIRQEVNLSAINYCASFHCVSHHEMRLELPNEMNRTGINVMTESWSKFVPLFSLPILIPRLTESISCCSFICVERNEAKYCDSWEPFEQFQIIDRIIEYRIYDGISQVEWLLLGMTAQPSPDIRLRNEEEKRKREPEIQRARKWMEMALNRLNEANVKDEPTCGAHTRLGFGLTGSSVQRIIIWRVGGLKKVKDQVGLPSVNFSAHLEQAVCPQRQFWLPKYWRLRENNQRGIEVRSYVSLSWTFLSRWKLSLDRKSLMRLPRRTKVAWYFGPNDTMRISWTQDVCNITQTQNQDWG